MRTFSFIYHYLVYRLRAVNAHGVHSPFVFNLLNDVIYNRVDYYSFQNIEVVRNMLEESEEQINVIDLGAGANKNNSIRKISSIAKKAAKAPKHAQLLFRLVNYFQPTTILELGTSLGISTSYLASANTASTVITIEGCPEIANQAALTFSKLALKNIRQYVGCFDQVLPALLLNVEQLDFVFFDGNHQKAPSLHYFEMCLEKATENSVFVFDDINWSDEMRAAWEEIKQHSRVIVTVDLFYMGIVFFRKEQAKQHFIIH